MVLMSLQEDEFMQTRSEMGVDFRRPLGDGQRTIGHSVYGSAIACVESLQHDVLDHEIPVAFQFGTVGQVIGDEDFFAVDADVFGLLSLGVPGRLPLGFPGSVGGGLSSLLGLISGRLVVFLSR